MYQKLFKCIVTVCFVVVLFLLMSDSSEALQVVKSNPYQSQLKLEELYIQLLPEYENPRNWDKNKPNLLVSYSGSFYNSSPQEFNDYIYLPVPVNSHMFTLSMVCETEKGMIFLPYEITDQYVRWKPSRAIKSNETYPFLVEYYLDAIKSDYTGNKNFNYLFAPEFSVPTVYVDVFLPLHSEEHNLHPLPYDYFVINNGINVFSYIYNHVNIEQPLELSVQYHTADHSQANFSRAIPYNDFIYTSVNYDFIGIVIFSLILLIMGFSVLTLSSRNKKLKISYVDYGRDKDSSIDETLLRKKDLRKLLIQGKINEQTYKALLDEEQNHK